MPPTKIGRGGPDRQVIPAHGGECRRYDAIQLTGFDRPQRLGHAERRIPPAIDGAALVLATILQFADAAFDLLLSRLRHSRHLRAVAARWSGVAWLRQAASVACGSPVRIGRAQRSAQYADRDFELARKTRLNGSITLSSIDEISCAYAELRATLYAIATRIRHRP
jgi:hypothetical protein